MRDFIRLEYEAKQRKEKLLKEAAIAKWIAEGGQVEKCKDIKKPKNQIWGKGFGKHVWKQSGRKGKFTIQKDRSKILRVVA